MGELTIGAVPVGAWKKLGVVEGDSKAGCAGMVGWKLGAAPKLFALTMGGSWLGAGASDGSGAGPIGLPESGRLVPLPRVPLPCGMAAEAVETPEPIAEDDIVSMVSKADF